MATAGAAPTAVGPATGTTEDVLRVTPSREAEQSSFESFARETLPSLLAYATVLTGDPHTAADVVQDVMVRAHGRWQHIAQVDHPRAYVRRMVTNQYLSWRRRWYVRSVVAVTDAVLQTRATITPDPAQLVVDRDDLRQRLARLPRRQQAVLVLRLYEGLPDTEIADLLGIATGTVRSDASRGLRALRIGTVTPEEI